MSELAVSVKDLVVQFGNFRAVQNITFSVKRGEIFGFLGANGAGKTTTIRVLCGLIVPTSGSVQVAGYDIKDGEFNIKSTVGYMSQKFTLYNDLTVEQNLDFVAALRKLDQKIYFKMREDLLSFVSFEHSMKTVVRDLPGGVKQHISLATALLHDPDIIFLDEPTAGVSPVSRARFWLLIKKLSKRGKTVFVTTHYMDEVEQCDRIALMRDGKVIGLDTPDNLKNTTFPEPLFEFDPKNKLTFEEILSLKKESIFSFFEPYGIRFHASIKNIEDWNKNRDRFNEKFYIQQIKPSMEDVFIKKVEIKE